tara:strand:- start:36 stop:440 length:405 start_codon:yes stop_codon:yes gene_type:complete
MATDDTPEENEENIQKPEQDDDSNNNPSRHNHRWSFEEENEIIEKLRKGMSWDQIAREHSRTIRAVQIRYAIVCEHAETLEIVRGPAKEGEIPSITPIPDPDTPERNFGKEPGEVYDVVRRRDSAIWYSFKLTN